MQTRHTAHRTARMAHRTARTACRTARHGWAWGDCSWHMPGTTWANGAPYGACSLQRYALRAGPLVATVLRDAAAKARI